MKEKQTIKQNYQKLLERMLEGFEKENRVPTLLLHSCCAPCSTYVIEYLSNYFHITVFYYNPNIDDAEEYQKRAREQQRLILAMPTKYPVMFVEGNYDVEAYLQKAQPMATEPEGGGRCMMCYAMRLGEAAKYAKAHEFEYFATTLTISPLKNAAKLNEIGEIFEKQYGVTYLKSDFKKKEGYKRSTELSETYGLYRQNHCGCSFSKVQ